MFAENLEKLCNSHGESLRQLAQAVGVDPSTASGWSRGAVPRKATLRKIAEHFEVSVEALLGEEPLPSISWVENTDLSGEPMFLNEREKLLVELFREASEIDRMRITHAVMEILKK